MQEPSQISKSGISMDNRYSRDLALGQSERLDSIFPYFDYITQHKDVWAWLKAITFFFLAAQNLYLSTWPWCGFYKQFQDKTIVNIMGRVLISIKPYSQTKNIINAIIIEACFASVAAISFLSIFIYYKKTRRFVRWATIISQFFHDVIIPLEIQPCMASFSLMLRALFSDGANGIQIIFFILISILLVFFVTANTITQKIVGKSSTKHFNVSSFFDSRPLTHMPLINGLSIIGQQIFAYYSDWSILLIMIFHFCSVLYLFHITINYGFHNIHTMCFFSGVLITILLMDITMYILTLVYGAPMWTPYVLCAVYTVIADFGVEIYNYFRTKKICSILNYPDRNTPYQDSNAHLEEFKVARSNRTLLNHIRVGFLEICDMFLDFTLFSYAVQSNSDNNILAEIINIMAYFPGEARKLNRLFSLLVVRRNLSIEERFLLFQVYRIKTTRQSSVSQDVNERGAEVRKQSRICESECFSFWNAQEPSLGYLEYLAKRVTKVNTYWLEVATDSPNNAKIASEYARFLTECTAQFDSALLYRTKVQMIEKGHSFQVDHSFIALVQSFPRYLKDHILDLRGFVVARVRKPRRQSSSASFGSSSHSSHNSSFNEAIDPDVEDHVGKQSISQGRVRLTLHHATEGRYSIYSYVIIWTVVACVAVTVALSGIMVYVISSKVRISSEMIQNIRYASTVRFSLALTQGQLTLRYALHANKLDTSLVEHESWAQDDGRDDAIYSISQIDERISSQLNQSEVALHNILNSISKMAREKWPVYKVAEIMLKNITTTSICRGMKVAARASRPLMSTIMLQIWTQQSLVLVNASDYYSDDRYCETTLGSFQIDSAADNLSEVLAQYETYQTEEICAFGYLMEKAAPIAIFFVVTVPPIIIIILFMKEQRDALKLLIGLPFKAKDLSKHPISKDITEEVTPHDPPNLTSKLWIYMVLYLIIGIVFALDMFYFFIKSIETAHKINKYNMWLLYSVRRLSYGASNINMALQMVLGVGVSTPIVKPSGLEIRLKAFNARMEQANKDLLNGPDGKEPCYGYDSVLDSINYEEICSLNLTDIEMHDTYKCTSGSSGISTLRSLITEMIEQYDQWNGILRDPSIFHLLHMSGTHVFEHLIHFNDRLIVLSNQANKEIKTNWRISIAFGVIIAVVEGIITTFLYQKMKLMNDMIMSLIKHAPPHAVITNKPLINFLLGRKMNQTDSSMGVGPTVIYGSSNPIFITNTQGVIDSVNGAVTQLLGYSPEQVLGQPFSAILPDDEAEDFDKSLQQMVANSARIFDGKCTALTDEDAEVPCSLAIMAMEEQGEEDQETESFVIVLADETKLKSLEQEAVEAREQVENLLEQILPPEIIKRMAQGEKEIAFQIQTVSFVVLDFERFSDYCMLLNPEDIMQALETIGKVFDEVLSKYPLLTKIRMIGDTYTVAGGLFAESDNPKAHATQACKFAIECLAALDDLNLRLNSGLQIRVGVNTGGPVVAGISGADRPVFEVVGEAMEVAIQLQLTDPPMRIQISQATRDFVEDSGLYIEERGEVELGHMGKRNTYYAMNKNSFMASFAHIDIPRLNLKL